MKALTNPNFDPALPLQTKKGAGQALKIGHNQVDELIKQKRLRTVPFGRLVRVTTKSIYEVARTGIENPSRRRLPDTANTTTGS